MWDLGNGEGEFKVSLSNSNMYFAGPETKQVTVIDYQGNKSQIIFRPFELKIINYMKENLEIGEKN